MLAATVATVVALAACRSLAPATPWDLAEPGWTVHQGQLVWQPKLNAVAITGDLLLARHTDGRSFVQFLKTPFPILNGRTTPEGWRMEFATPHRTFAGPGRPPARLIWLHLAACLLEDALPPEHWTVERRAREPVLAPSSDLAPSATPDPLRFRFKNQATGEALEGFLVPQRREHVGRLDFLPADAHRDPEPAIARSADASSARIRNVITRGRGRGGRSSRALSESRRQPSGA